VRTTLSQEANHFRRFLPASGIRRIFDRAKEIEASGCPVLHLEIGRPDYSQPFGAVQSAQEAMDAGLVHYIANRGLPELREAMAEDIHASAGIDFDPGTEIIVTTGASEALSMVALALLGPGDEVIIPEPAWSHYRAVVQMAGATTVALSLAGAGRGFVLDPEELAKVITDKTRMIVLNTPGNPSGAVQPPDVLREVARLAMKHGIFVFSDEVYKDFVYEGEHVSIGAFMADSDRFIYVNSLSKSYAMTGWRIGYVAARAEVSDALNRIHQYLTVCGVAFAQKGAVQALRGPRRQEYLAGMRKAFQDRRRIWQDAWADCSGFQCAAPGGAFYLFPRIDYRDMNAREFCNFMLDEHQVAMVPGDVFGDAYDHHVRISFGRDLSTQEAAAERLIGVINAG